MLLTIPHHIKIMSKQDLSQVDKLSVGTSVLEPSADMVDLRLPVASFVADSNQFDKWAVTSVMSSGTAIGVHEIGLWHEGKLIAIVYKTHDKVHHQPLFLIKPNFIYLLNLQIDKQTVTLTVDERDDLSFAMAGVLANTGKQSRAEKIALTNQFKALVDKDSLFEKQISSLTDNIATAQQSADNANEKTDNANSKADNAQNTANNALSRANTANSAITAEQRARADADNSLASRITALDTAYKSADSTLTARLAREETARTNGDNTNAQALRTLESTVNGIGGRVGASESKIATLERTTSNTNQALTTAQNQMNAKFDNLAVGSRNLILGSQVSRTTHGTTALSMSQNINYNNLTNLVLSVDVAYKNARKATAQGAKWFRIGAEFRFIYTDNTVKYFGAWAVIQESSPTTFNGRITNHISVPTEKTIKMIDLAQIQIWDIVADEMLVKNPKLEIGTIPTDWTPAPEDYTAGLAIYNTTTAQSPNVFVSDTGQLQRSTSSERYKEIISPLVLDDKAYKNAMKLNPIIYRSTAETDNPDWHYYSFSAEELAKFDKAFTLWRTPTEIVIDENDESVVKTLEPIAEGINLNAIVAFLHATNVKQGMLIRDLTKRIELLENKNNMEQ